LKTLGYKGNTAGLDAGFWQLVNRFFILDFGFWILDWVGASINLLRLELILSRRTR